MNEGLAHFLFVVGCGAIVPICYGLSEAAAARRERKAEKWLAENSRVSSGLPRHERCGCDECAAWRAVPANISGLQR